MAMRIAVTGGSGLVGRALVARALDAGHAVVSIDRAPPATADRPGLQALQIDLADYDRLEAALGGCDALVHLAAIPGPGGVPDHIVHNNNVVGSYNVLLAAASSGISRICQASSINAIGGVYSRWPRYDYFPLDEQHPTYSEDPYSLSKWLCEQQADSIVRRHEHMAIASLRLHGISRKRAEQHQPAEPPGQDDMLRSARHLWGYTNIDAAVRACLLALGADFRGHEVLYIVAPTTGMETPSLELAQRFFPAVPRRGEFSGNRGFYDCSKAERLLGWSHDVAPPALALDI